METISCPHCGAANPVNSFYAQSVERCAKCASVLVEPPPVSPPVMVAAPASPYAPPRTSKLPARKVKKKSMGEHALIGGAAGFALGFLGWSAFEAFQLSGSPLGLTVIDVVFGAAVLFAAAGLGVAAGVAYALR